MREIKRESTPARQNTSHRFAPKPTAPRLKRLQSFVQSMAAVLIVGIILGGFLILFNSHHLATSNAGSNYRWCVVPSSDPGTVLNGVAAISPTDAWAVGSNMQGKTFTEHWNGKQWVFVASPNLGNRQNNTLYSVTAVSTNDVWAVGQASEHAGETLVEHWNGKQWSIVPSPNRHPESYNNKLDAITAISSDDIWAVGESDNYSLKAPDNNISVETLIEHWDGKQWSIISSPNPGQVGSFLDGVAASSATDVWAVGEPTASGGPLIERWNGKQWSIVQNPKLKAKDAGLRAISVLSADNIWAVGFQARDGSTADALIEHWNGKSWEVIASPLAREGVVNTLNAVSAISTNDIWAVGGYSNTLIMYWNGQQWSIVPSPNPDLSETINNGLQGVTATSAEHVWAVGSELWRGRTRSLIETYCGSGS